MEYIRVGVIVAVIAMLSPLTTGLFNSSVVDDLTILSNRIISGSNAGKPAYRYNVWIRLMDEPVCGGSLIAEEWVLTAANCIDLNTKKRFYRIIIGDYNRKTEGDKKFREFKTKPKRFFIHPDYNPVTLESNIALIQLAKPAPLGRNTISLVPQLSTPQLDVGLTSNANCFMTGWGQNANGDPVKRLQVLPVSITPADSCSNINDGTKELCYSGSPGGACPTDEGNPITCIIEDVETQVGFHSKTLCSSANTAATKVSAFNAWIDETLNPPKTCGATPGVAEGEFISTGDNVGDTARLRCNSGFRVSSSTICASEIQCLDDGTWGSTDVTCVPACSSVGTTFMFGYLQNAFSEGDPYLYITSTIPATVTIRIPFLTEEDTVIEITKYLAVKLSDSLSADGNQEQSNKGVHISATAPISVYAHQYRPGDGPSADGTLIFPESCLTTSYLTVSNNFAPITTFLSEILVVGTEDSTSVTIRQASGTLTTFALNRFGTYQLRATDLTGAFVTASKSVAVLAGHECGSVPDSSAEKCDHLIEQMPPGATLQTEFIVTRLAPRPNFSVRIVAAFDQTTVSILDENGSLIEATILNRQQSIFRSFSENELIAITGTKGILVAQYGQGSSTDDLDYGDPSMVVYPGLNQFINSYQIYTPSPPDLYNRNWVAMIISDCYGTSGLRLNGVAVPDNGLEVITPNSGTYTVIYAEITAAENSITHTDPDATFGVIQYGFENLVEYAWVPGRIV